MAQAFQQYEARSDHIVVGVDTHKHVHVAAVMDAIGGTVATATIAADSGGYQQLLEWAHSFGSIIAFGIEGTGSYGLALASFARRNGHKVVEVNRPDRRLRRLKGKSDTLDAVNAARAVLSGDATAIPKSADGTVEMLRHLKIAYDTAVKDRSATMITLKALLVSAPERLRLEAATLTQLKLAGASPGCDPVASRRHGIRRVMRFGPWQCAWLRLNEEATELSRMIKELVVRAAPQTLQSLGIGVDTAAEILIVVGDNPERIRSEAALAKLAASARYQPHRARNRASTASTAVATAN